MRLVTWILRALSTVLFAYMSWRVYLLLQGYWNWNAAYDFVVSIFRLLSLAILFVSLNIIAIVTQSIMPGAQSLFTGIYGVFLAKMWYLWPSTGSAVVPDSTMIGEMLRNLLSRSSIIIDEAFSFLYLMFAVVAVMLFLQSIVRMDHKFVSGAFVCVQLILAVAAFRGIYQYTSISQDFLLFLQSDLQILVLVSFAYLEVSYQMIYSHTVGKPIEDREEYLKQQLLALRKAARKQEALERGEDHSGLTSSKLAGATVFSFLREVMERKASTEDKMAFQLLDTVSDVRRLQIYVDELIASDPNASSELTAKASAPSQRYVALSTVMGSLARFAIVIPLSFILLSPSIVLGALTPPIGVRSSVEFVQPEIIMLYFIPIILVFPFTAMLIRNVFGRDQSEEKKTESDERMKKREIARRLREARAARRKMKREARKTESGHEEDEWDKALSEMTRS
ncbi:MAG: hypothetical protein QXS20_05040 [Candidatus Thorarchaeota archaeon]